MRVGFDISVLRIAQAGVLTYTRELLDAMTVARADVDWTLIDLLPLNPDRPLRLLAALAAPGVRVVRCAGLNRPYLSARPGWRRGVPHAVAAQVDRALDPLWAQASVAAVGFQLRAALAGVQVFHSSDQFCYAPPGAAAVVTIHDLTAQINPAWHISANNALADAKLHFARMRADLVIADSQSTARDAMRLLNLPGERLRVVPLAADRRFRLQTPEALRPQLARFGLRPDEYLLSVGTLEPRKNYVRLIEAYARLRGQMPAAPPLVIIGRRGWHYDEILAAPARWGVAGRVRFVDDARDVDLPALYAGAAAFVYPSLYEGFGLPVLEALACGAPTACANTSSLPEVLGDAGVLFAAEDPLAIAAALEQLLSDLSLRARLRQAGPQRAAQFSWQRTAQETLAVYEEAIALRRAPRGV